METQVRDVIDPRLVDIEGTWRALGIKRSSLYALLASGELKSVKIGARRLIKVTDLDAYVASLQVED